MGQLFYRFLLVIIIFTLIATAAIFMHNFSVIEMVNHDNAETLAASSSPMHAYPGTGQVIGAETAAIAGDLTVHGNLTVDNIVYHVQAGDGISVSTGQSPTISNAGVLSFGEKTGTITLGDGLSIDTFGVLSNSDQGSQQALFATIKIGDASFSAGANNDTLTFSAGNGIALTSDADNKKITITSTNTSSATDLLGNTWKTPGAIGSTTPSSGSFTTLSTSDATNISGKMTLSYVGDSGYLSSNGGAMYVNNTNNIGTGIGIFSNAGSEALGNMINVKVDNPAYAQAAFYMNYDGSSNAVEIVNNGNDDSSNALAVTGNNIYDSTLGIIGHELSRGTIKVSHYRPPGGTDSNASAISVDLKGSGTRAQGIYVDSTESGGTLGNLLRLRNTSIDKFVVDYQGNITSSGNIIQGSYGTDTSWTKYGNTTGDQFFVGTNGSFRIQRAYSNSEAFRVQINGDTQGRWRGTSDGSMQWGDGTNAQDVILKRGAAGMLWLTGGMVFNNGKGDYDTVVKGMSESNLFFVDASTDRIGIARSSPQERLHLANGNLRVGGGSLCVQATDTACAGNTAGTIYASNTTVQAADLAENYISSERLEPGDIVLPASDGNYQAVRKTTHAYQSAIGIVSTKPGVTLNSDATTDETHPYVFPIALQGRVYLKVTTENGAIVSGDLLTASSLPGVAMKATKQGSVVAKALENYDASDSQHVGKIMVFVFLSETSSGDSSPVEITKNTGQVTLPAGETSIEVSTASASAHARLFVEPEDIPLATAVKKKSKDTFTITIGSPQPQAVILNWWLLN